VAIPEFWEGRELSAAVILYRKGLEGKGIEGKREEKGYGATALLVD